MTRADAAREVAGVIAAQVEELIVSGDIMGGRALVAARLRAVATAEVRGDDVALRAAWLELAVAAGACVAAIDFEPPARSANGAAEAEPVA